MALGNGDIIAAIEKVAGQINALSVEVSALRSDMNRGFAEVNARIDKTNVRIDQVIENTGTHWRDHEDRIRALEAKAGPT